jgi:hypothetical protein
VWASISFAPSLSPTRQWNKEFHSVNPITTSLSTAMYAASVVRLQRNKRKLFIIHNSLTRNGMELASFSPAKNIFDISFSTVLYFSL